MESRSLTAHGDHSDFDGSIHPLALLPIRNPFVHRPQQHVAGHVKLDAEGYVHADNEHRFHERKNPTKGKHCDEEKGKRRGVSQKSYQGCLLYTSPSPRDLSTSRMPSSA